MAIGKQAFMSADPAQGGSLSIENGAYGAAAAMSKGSAPAQCTPAIKL